MDQKQRAGCSVKNSWEGRYSFFHWAPLLYYFDRMFIGCHLLPKVLILQVFNSWQSRGNYHTWQNCWWYLA
jgi:hypothetical protein